MTAEELSVLDPRPVHHGGDPVKTAPRLDTLQGKTIGLLWNGKAMGDVALRRVGEQVAKTAPDVKVRFYSGSMPCSPTLLKQAAEECDGFIGCTADCGSCSSWMTHDCVQLERMGKPTVILASKGFEHDVEVSARAFAMPDPYYVVVPLVYNNLNEAQAIAQTDPAVAEIIAKLTTPETSAHAADGEPVRESWTYRADGDELTLLRRFNEDFLSRDWGDGYPLWPPTNSAVRALMDGVDGAPDDVVCLLPPGNGQATVEKVAINAAMADYRPEEMPVVVSILRAISQIRPVPRGALMSTSAHAPLVLVNGPLGRQLGINGKRACLGPGRQNEVNIRISRAVVLSLKNIGSWYPGVMDMDSIGTTRKNIVVVAENEDESPWEPFHVGRGFERDDDAVSVFFTIGEWDISIQGATDARQLARAIASFSGGINGGGYFTTLRGQLGSGGDANGRLLFIPPPHAIPLAQEAGFSKKGLERYMYEQGRETIARLIEPVRKLHADGKFKPEWEWLFDLTDEQARTMTLPVIETPASYHIAVVGSVRAKDMLMPLGNSPITVPITAKV